jgi:hypothetical protein
MAAMLAATVTYTVGWLFNFVVLSGLRRYSGASLVSALAGGAMPPSWEREDASERVRAALLKDEAEWNFAQRIGPFRYIVVRGGLLFGAVAFVCIHIVLNLIQSQPIVFGSLPLKFVLWVLFGILLSAPRWWVLKRASRSEA